MIRTLWISSKTTWSGYSAGSACCSLAWFLVGLLSRFGGGINGGKERIERVESGTSWETQPLTFSIGESAYLASNPYVPDREVNDIILQVMLGNPNPTSAKTVMTFRLDVSGKDPYPLSEPRLSERTGGWFLVPAGGGFSNVPTKDYLKVPITVPAGGAIVGWIGFCTLARMDLLLEEAWKINGDVVAILADGTEYMSSLPVCTLPQATED